MTTKLKHRANPAIDDTRPTMQQLATDSIRCHLRIALTMARQAGIDIEKLMEEERRRGSE